MYTIFKRPWWKWETGALGRKLVPNSSPRRTTITHVETEQEAQQYCKEWNAQHDPGATSIKAEYTSE